MTVYTTKDDHPGILFAKQDGLDVLAANQPAMLEDRGDIGCDRLHRFAVAADGGTVRLAIDTGTDNRCDVWMVAGEAQELIDALRISVASAKAIAARAVRQ